MKSDVPIKSIELQLVRVETCGTITTTATATTIIIIIDIVFMVF